MSDVLEPGDFVEHPRIKGVRGQVLWTDGPYAHICWETGYEPYIRHDYREEELKKINALDLIVEGREIEFDHSAPVSRCLYGHKLQRSSKRFRGERLTICPVCRVHYCHDGKPHTDNK